MEESKNFNPADANAITRRYLDSILIEERLIDAVKASTKTTLFGHTYDSPIMMPAFSHLDEWVKNGKNSMVEYSAAAKNLNILNFVGMRENDKMNEIFDTQALTVRIIKPYRERKKIFDQIEYAKTHNAVGVGMDIDHIFGGQGDYDIVQGEPMAAQTMDMIREYVQAAAPLPFIVKGVLSVRDAVKCADCQVSAILVSHHSGRMPYAIPPLKVVPSIRKAVGSEMKIFVDCGISRGADVFKALALGCDGAAVGRAILPALKAEGREGVEKYIRKMNDELRLIMGFTGTPSVDKVDPSVLWMDGCNLGI